MRKKIYCLLLAAILLLSFGLGCGVFGNQPRDTGISIASYPYRISGYRVGDAIDLDGGELVVSRSDSTTRTVAMTSSAVSVSQTHIVSQPIEIITLSYSGFSVDLALTVDGGTLTVSGELSRTTFFAGTNFDPSGLVFTFTSAAGTSRVVSHENLTFVGSPLELDATSVTVLYQGLSVLVSGFTVVERPPVSGVANSKRGVGYNFRTSHTTHGTGATAVSDLHTRHDMGLLTGGDVGISWFYNWGSSINAAVEQAARDYNVDFMPMAWRYLSVEAEAELRTLVARNPNIRYLRAINEPNLTQQGARTPEQFATAPRGWPTIRRVAQELDLKIIAPAMNFGTLPGYSNPNLWLEEFFAHPDVDINDFHALSLNVYMSWPGAFKGFIERFYHYDLPIWITEFCAWYGPTHGVHNRGERVDWEWQSYFMSQSVAFMEQNPRIERYAWFIPKGNRDPFQVPRSTYYPDNFLLTRTNPPMRTDLGIIYTSMSTFDRERTFAVNTRIDAAQMSRNNIYDHINITGHWRSADRHSDWDGTPSSWADSVNFWPNTDTAYRNHGELEVRDFLNNQWIEYELEVTQAGTHAINIRHQRQTRQIAQANNPTQRQPFTTNPSIIVQVNGIQRATHTFTSNAWATTSIPIGHLSQGRHTIRIHRNNVANLSLNWLEVNRV